MKQNINTYRHSEQILPLYKGSENDCFGLYPSQFNIDNKAQLKGDNVIRFKK